MDHPFKAVAPHDHVIAPPLRLGGTRVGTTSCRVCGRGLAHVLADRGVSIVRPGWEGAIAFTDWNRGVTLVRA